MKKWLFLLVASIILGGCNSGENDSAPATSTENPDTASMVWDQDNWDNKNWD